METCCADSARARANMWAAFLGGGGGGAVVEAVELMEQEVVYFDESGDTTPSKNTKRLSTLLMK